MVRGFIQRVTVPLALLLALASAAMAQTPAPGDDAVFEERLGALIDNVRLPLLAEVWHAVTTEMRASMAGIFLGGMAKGAKLDARWSPGNPHYDRALRLVEKAIGGEEARAGPLFGWSRSAFLRSFRPPWSVGEIDFLIDVTRTDDGRIITEFYDAASVRMLIRGLGESPFGNHALRDRLEELRLEARDKFGVAAPRFAEARERNPGPVNRAMALLQRMDSEQIGYDTVRRMYQEPTQRLSRAVFDVLPDLHAEIAAFKRSIGEPDAGGRT